MEAFLNNPHGAALDLLGHASTRIIYDVRRYHTSQKPVFAGTIARETHVSDLRVGEQTKTQISLSYSDGFGQEIQKKLQAEPGCVNEGGPLIHPRWIGSGWTIFNNKGKPVRQYEPFFSSLHDFEFASIKGVSPILFYDPVERVVATLKKSTKFGDNRITPNTQPRRVSKMANVPYLVIRLVPDTPVDGATFSTYL